MASIQRKNNAYYCQFLYLGKRHTITVGAANDMSPDDVEAFAGNVDHLLFRLKRNYLQLPPGVHITDFILHNGNVPPETIPATKSETTFGQLRDRYLETYGNGAMEPNSLETAAMHLRHLEKTLGAEFIVQALSQADLQRHINRRAKAKGIRGRKISPITLRKEIASFRAAWNWSATAGIVQGAFPNRGLVFPKSDEKPPFQTRKEIERQIARGGLTPAQMQDLWDCLFLTRPEIDELLDHVKANSTQPFIYPMICMAAHTGARRSELLRCQIADIDFDGGTILIREKKKSREKRTTRRAPLSSFLAKVLRQWLDGDHPGGTMLFTQYVQVIRSRTKRSVPTPATRNESHDHLQRTLADSKWAVLKGWHVLRHSFISNCAAAGVDQRMLDQWVGHTTEVRKRYLHLIPSNERKAIETVFGTQ